MTRQCCNNLMIEGTKESKLCNANGFLITDKNNSARLCVGRVGGQVMFLTLMQATP